MSDDQWCAGQAECLECGCAWVAVWPLACAPLHCPACDSDDTYRWTDDAEL